MKKAILLILTLALLMTAVSAFAADGTVTMRWFITLADDHPVSVAARKMAESVSAETNGRIQLEIYSNSVLGNESEGMDMIRMGTVEAGIIGAALYPDYSEASNVVLLPYTFGSVAGYMAWMRQVGMQPDGPFGDEFTQATGCDIISAHASGFRHLTTNKQVKSPADLAGMNIRALPTELGQAVVNGLGGNAVAVAFAELYTALQTNVVDGQENPLSTIYANKFYEVQSNLCMTGHLLANSFFVVNDAFWKSLTDEDRAVIQKYVDIAADEINEDAVSNDDNYIALLEAEGMTILKPDAFDYDAFKESCIAKVKETFSGSQYDSWWTLQAEIQEWLTANGY